VMTHCRYCDEIIAADVSHLMSSESGGAGLSGALVRALPSQRGVFTGAQVAAAVRPQKINAPKSRLVHVEQTVNRGGGAIWPLEALTEVARAAKDAGLALHMDGARLFNAAAATGLSLAELTAPADLGSVALSKGLGCPVGSLIAGRKADIDRAVRVRRMFGGAMRQSGIIAAAGLYALDHNIARLSEDHANARLLAEGLMGVRGIDLDLATVQTNIVIFRTAEGAPDAATVVARAKEKGVLVGAFAARTVRAVTHLDVTRDQARRASEVLAAAVAAR